MPTGTIRTWIDDRGFGFITPDEGGTDVFVHFSGIRSGRIKQGDAVEYSTQTGERTGKLEAVDVTKVSR